MKSRHRRAGAQARKTTRLTVSLDAATARRLRAFSAWHGRSIGSVVGEGLRPVLKGFKVSQEVAGNWQPSVTPGPDQGAQDAA